MEYNIKVRVSNRHIHLTKETYNLLFDNELTKRNDLNQLGQFAANETVTIKYGDNVLENVRIVGPYRNYNQIEISKRDARYLKVNPPVRRSGDTNNTPIVTLITDKASVEVNGLIISNRHIHMNREDAKKYGVEDKQLVKIKINGDKSGIIDAEIKVSDDGFYELHIDTDDANAFLIEDNTTLTMII